jgi:hypothetical protein
MDTFGIHGHPVPFQMSLRTSALFRTDFVALRESPTDALMFSDMIPLPDALNKAAGHPPSYAFP